MYSIYRNNQVETSDPLGLILMTYDAVNRSLALARVAVENGDMQAEADHTSRVLEALIELSCSLDMDKGGEIARNLAALYAYMAGQLQQSMFSGNTEVIDEAMRLATTLREGWLGLRDSNMHGSASNASVTHPSSHAMTMQQRLAVAA